MMRIVFVVIQELLYAIAGSGGINRSDATMPIANQFAILQGKKGG
jgi:hypothetical protein